MGIGILLLALMIAVFGVDKLISDIVSLGAGFIILIAIYFFNQLFLTYGWRLLIMKPFTFSKFVKLLAARIAGDSTTVINAAAGAAGDGLKAMYIKDTIPFNTALASVLLDRIVHSLGNILILLTGVILSAVLLGVPFYFAAPATAVVLILLFLSISYISRKKHFLLQIADSLPAFIKKRFLTDKRRETVIKIDSEFTHIFSGKKNMRHFYGSLILHYVPVMLAGTLEVYFIMDFLSVDNLSFLNSLFIYLFGLVVAIILPFIPLNLAVSEGSYAAACVYFGYDPSLGISIGFIRRARALVWSFAGIALLLYAGLLKKENPGNKENK